MVMFLLLQILIADASILAVADETSGSINFNGDDAVALVKRDRNC